MIRSFYIANWKGNVTEKMRWTLLLFAQQRAEGDATGLSAMHMSLE